MELRPKSRTRKPARSMKKVATSKKRALRSCVPASPRGPDRRRRDHRRRPRTSRLRCHRRRRIQLPRHARAPRRRDPRPATHPARLGCRPRLRRGYLHRRSQRPAKKEVNPSPVTQVVSTYKHRGHNHSSSHSQDGQPSTLTVLALPPSTAQRLGRRLGLEFGTGAMKADSDRDAKRAETPPRPSYADLLGIVPALVSIVLGSIGMVNMATSLSRQWKLANAITGMLILAVLTGIPNIVTAVQLARRGRGSAVLSEALNSTRSTSS